MINSFSMIIFYFLCSRCPSGVGKWASSFIQIPLIDLNHQENNFHLDYIITSLAIVLLPVSAREKFLEQVIYYLILTILYVFLLLIQFFRCVKMTVMMLMILFG